MQIQVYASRTPEEMGNLWGEYAPNLSQKPKFLYKEGVVECYLLEIVVPAACAAVTRLHVGYQQQRTIVGLERAQFGYILGRLPVHYLAVVQAGLDQDRGITYRLEIVIGRVTQHVMEILGLVGIAPLFVLRHGKRQRS